MGDILYDDAITSQLGDDLTLYFLSLYADLRGYNLRNELAHGDLDADLMSSRSIAAFDAYAAGSRTVERTFRKFCQAQSGSRAAEDACVA